MILQNFVPHPKYYGAEVADIADEAALEQVGGAGDPSGGAPLSLREFPPDGSPALPLATEEAPTLQGLPPSACQLGEPGWRSTTSSG